MTFVEAQDKHIGRLVALDKKSYGAFGEDERYFREKVSSPTAKVVIMETNGELNGFCVFDVMKPNNTLENFINLNTSIPPTEQWMHISAFTTESNFRDIVSDTKLLLAAENMGINLGCGASYVPLTVQHPYKSHGVFEFFETNGYRNVGTIDWVNQKGDILPCLLYRKELKK